MNNVVPIRPRSTESPFDQISHVEIWLGVATDTPRPAPLVGVDFVHISGSHMNLWFGQSVVEAMQVAHVCSGGQLPVRDGSEALS